MTISSMSGDMSPPIVRSIDFQRSESLFTYVKTWVAVAMRPSAARPTP